MEKKKGRKLEIKSKTDDACVRVFISKLDKQVVSLHSFFLARKDRGKRKRGRKRKTKSSDLQFFCDVYMSKA